MYISPALFIGTAFTYLSSLAAASRSVAIFNVSDSVDTFSGNTIECGLVDFCHILCLEDSGCTDMTVEASNATNLLIECVEDSACYEFQLVSGPTNNLSILCTDREACRYGHIDIRDLDTVIVKCGYLSCDSLDLRVSDASSVTAECIAPSPYCLNDASMNFENVPRILLNATSFYAFTSGSVYLSSDDTSSETGTFDLVCDGTRACYDLEIYSTDHDSRYVLAEESRGAMILRYG